MELLQQARLRSRNRVQLVTALSRCVRFHPMIFLLTRANLLILPAACTHHLQRNVGYSFFPRLTVFTAALKTVLLSSSVSAASMR